ncbi:hypothetical protein C8R45DRAFT_923796 [Mycena sanguinolenta]|nr:hypothetical protein C8R45DRAFT_923796 [Mycena sanguinolenta]
MNTNLNAFSALFALRTMAVLVSVHDGAIACNCLHSRPFKLQENLFGEMVLRHKLDKTSSETARCLMLVPDRSSSTAEEFSSLLPLSHSLACFFNNILLIASSQSLYSVQIEEETDIRIENSPRWVCLVFTKTSKRLTTGPTAAG